MELQILNTLFKMVDKDDLEQKIDVLYIQLKATPETSRLYDCTKKLIEDYVLLYSTVTGKPYSMEWKND